MNSNKVLIEVKNISKEYILEGKSFMALDNISFTLSRNDRIGLIGKNGSGKSTLLKILSGLIKPSSGSVIINGKINSLIEIGSNFIMDLTGRENVKQFLRLNNVPKNKLEFLVDEVKNFSELKDFFEKPVKFYSSGMFVRLSVSVGFHVDADIFLIDEVLMAGDLEFREKVNEKFFDVTTSGAAIILASHSIEEIMNNTKKCLWIEHGKAVKIEYTSKVLNDFLIKKANNVVDQNKALIEEYKKENFKLITDINDYKGFNSNEWAEILAFQILNPNAISYSSGFSIFIKIKSKIKGQDIFPSLKISDHFLKSFAGLISPNNKDFISEISAHKSADNTYSIKCTVPGKIFSPGIFHINLKINSINDSNSDYLNDLYTLPNPLSFEIKEDENIKYTNSILSDIQVAPECEWKIQ